MSGSGYHWMMGPIGSILHLPLLVISVFVWYKVFAQVFLLIRDKRYSEDMPRDILRVGAIMIITIWIWRQSLPAIWAFAALMVFMTHGRRNAVGTTDETKIRGLVSAAAPQIL
jgi:hypothetical protein